MLKAIITTFSLLLFFTLSGQVIISPQLPQGGLVHRDQLLNFTLVNNSLSQLDVFVTIEVKERLSGTTVFNAVAKPIRITPGLKIITKRDLYPLVNTTDLIGSEFLEAGEYIICYSVNKNSERADLVATECTGFMVSALSPILLQYPDDKAVLDGNPGRFSWLPPSPLKMFRYIQFDLVIAEVLEGQTPADALAYNVAVYSKRGSRLNHESYPSSYAKLVPGRSYAWQVTGRSGLKRYLSDVWTFSIQKDTIKAEKSRRGYLEFTSAYQQAGAAHISELSIDLKYYSFDQKKVTSLQLIDPSTGVVKVYKRPFNYGDNFFKLQLPNTIRKNTTYTIQIIDSQNNAYKAYFILN